MPRKSKKVGVAVSSTGPSAEYWAKLDSAMRPIETEYSPRAGKKVAIVGAAPSSRDLAPYKDDTWEIWGCSPSNRSLPRITSWFENHDIHFLKHAKSKHWAEAYAVWLREQKFRIVMQCENDIVPGAFVYPWEKVKQTFCPHGGYLLTSSIAEMIALAMLEGAQEIALYGVDMAADSEWAYELPGCQIWIARARERGIKVYVPDDSSLDRPIPIYGLDDSKPEARKLREHSAELVKRRAEVADRLNAIDAEKAQLLRTHYHLDGAIEQNAFVRKTFISWSGPDA